MVPAPSDAERLSLELERVVRALRALIADDPLSPSAAAVLSRIDTDGPTGVTALARAEHVSQPAMTQLVSRLHADGLITRGTADGDRRAVRVSLTVAGAAALENRRRIRAGRVDEALRSLGGDRAQSLVDALPALGALTAALHDAYVSGTGDAAPGGSRHDHG